MDIATQPRHQLVCLLPVRNGAGDLEGYLASVAGVADAVVALDDGSMDGTRDILEAHPLVKTVLSNPPRESYLGWHDGENRNRLLAAAADLHPGWILFLDADERIDPSDAAALRTFLDSDAIPGCAYGFKWYRMFGDGSHDPAHAWVYRLFAYRPGQRVPNRRLLFTPVPTSIAARVNTTLRIQHFGEQSDAGRQARLAKYREADPTGEYASFVEEMGKPLGQLPHEPWTPRPAGLPLLVPLETPSAVASEEPAALSDIAPVPAPRRRRPRPLVVCLIPARNCEDDLLGWFESVSRIADAVVALDDGSTDGTASVLASHPMVKVLLRNEPRETFAGWDDGANRNRLLHAAHELEPDWILSLDADERVPRDDALALRAFLDAGAAPTFAYGFPRYAMIGDLDHYDHVQDVVWRLFAWSPGQRFSDDRVHTTPIPIDLPEARRLETTIRIQHIASLTDERRRLGWLKHHQAHPDALEEPILEALRSPPGDRRTWPQRKLNLPEVLDPVDPEKRLAWEAAQLDLGGPVLSVVVLSSQDATEQVLATVRSVLEDADEDLVEVLVTAPSGLDVARVVAETHESAADLRIVPSQPVAATPWTDAAARNAGLRAARGDYVLYIAAGETIAPKTLSEILKAHERGNAMVTGEVVNRCHSPIEWTSYFLDHPASLPGGLVGLVDVAPSAASWAREPLIREGGFPEGLADGGAAVAGQLLMELGHRCWRTSVTFEAVSVHPTLAALLVDQARRGYALGRRLRASGDRPDAHRAPNPFRGSWQWAAGYGPRRFAAIRHMASFSDPAMSARFRRRAPAVAVGIMAEWAGLAMELLRGGRVHRSGLDESPAR
jgi:glycosyltransferase involved in cell wall biosynthesis